METEVPREMKMEGTSGNLMVMAQQSRVRTRDSDTKNLSDRGEESVMVACGKSARDEEVTIAETEESVKEAEESVKKEAQEGALLLVPDPIADESLLHKEAEAESGKRFRIFVDGKLYPAITCQEAEKLMNEIHERREALKRDLQAKQDAKGKETKAKAKAKVEEAGKAEVSVTEAGRPEESATEAEEDEEGALLVGMDSTGGVSSIQKQVEDGALLNSTGGEPLMRKEPERQLYAEIQRASLDIQEKLTEKNWKTDKRTLQLLKDMSNKLDMLDQGGDDNETDEIDDRGELDIDQTCLDTNDAFFKPAKLFLDPLAKEMADEAESFASHTKLWEYKWGKTRGFFRDPTVISSMQFTHYTPGRVPYSMECTTLETLQIISIKLTELSDGLELPLSVYGVVAVRDMVDRKRNILFSRDMSNPQELKQNEFNDIDYAPDTTEEPTFHGLAVGSGERCRVHNLEPVRCVAFEGPNTGRRFYLCSIENHVLNCGFHAWVDSEWPEPLQNALKKLWGMYYSSNSGRIDDKLEHARFVEELAVEKNKIEKKLILCVNLSL
ncbi:hypothetical protein ACQ4PT_003085 [Festuca glaucescens]